jgi:hypothetical protein
MEADCASLIETEPANENCGINALIINAGLNSLPCVFCDVINRVEPFEGVFAIEKRRRLFI